MQQNVPPRLAPYLQARSIGRQERLTGKRRRQTHGYGRWKATAMAEMRGCCRWGVDGSVGRRDIKLEEADES